jgi:hypothetical protein
MGGWVREEGLILGCRNFPLEDFPASEKRNPFKYKKFPPKGFLVFREGIS